MSAATDGIHTDFSEGMSYGMMICVQLNKKREFDALWNWSKTYMQNTDPENPSQGYFAWSMGTLRCTKGSTVSTCSPSTRGARRAAR